MRKLTILMLVILLLLGSALGGYSVKKTRVGWITDDSYPEYWSTQITDVLDDYTNDNSINYLIYTLSIKSSNHTTYDLSARRNDVTISTQWQDLDSVVDTANSFSSKYFIVIDNTNETIPENMNCYTSKVHEGSFLVGVIAAMSTKTDKIAFIGGMNFDFINQFEIGYIAGAKTVNPDIEISVAYADSFANETIGYILAKEFYTNGIDIIYSAAGATGNGAISAAEDFSTETDYKWAIGVDIDQSFYSPEHVLCSMVKNYGAMVDYALDSYLKNKYTGGSEYSIGLNEDAVGFSDLADNVSQDIKNIANNYKAIIISGDIIVPVTYPELDAYLSTL
ncbi:MAG: BMP family ABC transporter substrate-binding protein [Bacillota bacterium]|nr:BMP family ABC transporter substrate-binding protein [Bacillota bacterium]